MTKIIDNQIDLKDNLIHSNMINVIKEYSDDAIDFKMHIGSGFFFIDSLNYIYNNIDFNKVSLGDDIYEEKWGTKAPLLIMMGKQTNEDTKTALLSINNMFINSLNNYSDNEINTLENLVTKNLINFKVFTDKRFHAKIYFFYNNNVLEDIYVGSANFTPAGLSSNIELTSPISADKNIRKAHEEWYLNLWNRSTSDFNVLEIIKNFKNYDFIYYSPENFFKNLIRILNKDYLFHDSTITDDTLLVEFQSFDFYQVMKTLEKYNGCILASSVGLGKSYVALEVIKYFENNNKDALLIGPSNLIKNGEWDNYLKQYNLEVEKIGFGDLQQDLFDVNNLTNNYELIVVDEAHNLRNKSNRRDRMIEITNRYPNAKYLFLTATPINTRISDLNNLIDLFYEVNKDTWLGKDLKTQYETFRTKVNKFERSNKDNNKEYEKIQDLQTIIEREIIVKTTRNIIQKYFQNDLMKLSGSTEIIKPNIRPIEYSYNKNYQEEIFNKIADFLFNLSYEYAKFRSDGDNNYEYIEDLNLLYTYKWIMYKRAESSLFAFYKSLLKMKRNINNYISLFEGKDIQNNISSKDKNKYLWSKNLFDNESKNFQDNVLNNLKKDLISVKNMIISLERYYSEGIFINDGKFEKLKEIFEQNPNKKILIFTQFVDSVEYIYKFLKKEKINVEYVAGRDIEGYTLKQNKKISTINKFKNNEIQHLISTDVLSEGFNLPETDIIINFDLPYNPVVLIQRIGRATRINVQKKLTIMNFKPDETIDQELNLIEKLDMRISNIINMIGIDYNIWSNTEDEIKKREKKDNINKEVILNKLKEKMANENPEDLYNIELSEESKLDLLIKHYIKQYNLTIEDIPNKKPNKPIYTKLLSKTHKFYGIYNLGNNFKEYGNLDDSLLFDNTLNKSYSEKNIEKLLKIIQKEQMSIKIKREDQTNDSESKKIKKIISELKNIYPLKVSLNKILGNELYTNKEIEKKLKEIYKKYKSKDFIIFKEGKTIQKWKKELNHLIENNISEEGNIENYATNIENYKKYITAFIQYQDVDTNEYL